MTPLRIAFRAVKESLPSKGGIECVIHVCVGRLKRTRRVCHVQPVHFKTFHRVCIALPVSIRIPKVPSAVNVNLERTTMLTVLHVNLALKIHTTVAKEEIRRALIAQLDGRPLLAVRNANHAVPEPMVLAVKVVLPVNTVQAVWMLLCVMNALVVLLKATKARHLVFLASQVHFRTYRANRRATSVLKTQKANEKIRPNAIPVVMVPRLRKVVLSAFNATLVKRASVVVVLVVNVLLASTEPAVWILLDAMNAQLDLVKVIKDKRRVSSAVPVNSTMFQVPRRANLV
jgi:hypothetical protein